MTKNIAQGDKVAASGLVGNRRGALLGGAMLLAGAVAYLQTPRHALNYLGARQLEDIVPKQFGGWKFETTSGLVLPPKDQLRDELYSQLLTRTYSRAGQRVMLLIAYNSQQTGTVQVHRPEVCYPASGYHLDVNVHHDVVVNPHVTALARYIVAATPTYSEQMIYWTRIGPYFPSRWVEQRVAVAKSNLHGDIPDGILVRVSTTEPGDVRPLLDGFIRSLYEQGGNAMRSVLFGFQPSS